MRYISGYIIKRLKQNVHRLKDCQYKVEKQECLEILCNEEVLGDMTNKLIRGGLTLIKTETFQMFLCIEGIFRECTMMSGVVDLKKGPWCGEIFSSALKLREGEIRHPFWTIWCRSFSLEN